MNPFARREQVALAIIPKISSLPSIAGALFIIQRVLRSSKRRRCAYHRIMLAMSSMDLMFSLQCFLSTWPLPAEQPFIFGNVGNAQTCTATGFLGLGASLSSAVYSATLAFYFLLTIRYGCTPAKPIFHKLQWVIHLLPLFDGWITATIVLALGLYNSIGWICWIAAPALDCQEDETLCEQQEGKRKHNFYRRLLVHSQEWIALAFIIFCLASIYLFIWKRERNGSGHFLARKHHARAFAIQALLYAVAYFVTNVVPLLIVLFFGEDTLVGIYVALMVRPLIGFFNALIYARPRYLRYQRRRHSHKKRGSQSRRDHLEASAVQRDGAKQSHDCSQEQDEDDSPENAAKRDTEKQEHSTQELIVNDGLSSNKLNDECPACFSGSRTPVESEAEGFPFENP